MNPEPEQTLRGQYAGFASRGLAFLIDLGIVNAVVAIVTTVTLLVMHYFNYGQLFYTAVTDEPTTLATIITGVTALGTTLGMYFGYIVLFWVISGQTLGKRLLGLRVVQMDGSPMTFRRGTVRLVGYWISFIPFLLGFFWVLWDDQRRAWHDKLAGTCVIYNWDASVGPLLRDRLAREVAKHQQAQQPGKSRHASP